MASLRRALTTVMDALPPGGALVVVAQGPQRLASLMDKASLTDGLRWGDALPPPQDAVAASGEPPGAIDPASPTQLLAQYLRARAEAMMLFPDLRQDAQHATLHVGFAPASGAQ